MAVRLLSGRFFAFLALVLTPSVGLAVPPYPPPQCNFFCSSDCVKPISIPDRWNDSGASGWTSWADNGIWDSEAFTDANGNGIWDPGEPFQDGRDQRGQLGPHDGTYNSEFYDPILTGYDLTDHGAQLSMIPSTASPPDVHYYFVVVPRPPDGPSNVWTECNPSVVGVGDNLVTEIGNLVGSTVNGVRALINQDLAASWDDGCRCAVGSTFQLSPRYIAFVAHDPRVPLTPSQHGIHVTKIMGFFIEGVVSDGRIRGRIAVISRAGVRECDENEFSFLHECAIPTGHATWGALRALYR